MNISRWSVLLVSFVITAICAFVALSLLANGNFGGVHASGSQEVAFGRLACFTGSFGGNAELGFEGTVNITNEFVSLNLEVGPPPEGLEQCQDMVAALLGAATDRGCAASQISTASGSGFEVDFVCRGMANHVKVALGEIAVAVLEESL